MPNNETMDFKSYKKFYLVIRESTVGCPDEIINNTGFPLARE
jgi:hypothetical protein